MAAKWICTQLLPGIIGSMQNYTANGSIVVPADPNFLDLGTDFGVVGGVPYGVGTPFQMPRGRSGAIDRAWRTRGWNVFQMTSSGQYTPRSPSGCKVSIANGRFTTGGAIYNDYALPGSGLPAGVGPGGDSPAMSGDMDISCFTPGGTTPDLDPPSFGVWAAVDGSTATSVGFGTDVFNPTGTTSWLYGRNKEGNFNSPLGRTLPAASLEWGTRLDPGDMTSPYTPSVVIARIPLPVADPTYPFFRSSDIAACVPYTPGGPLPTPVMVPHSIVIRASAYGNASSLRYGSGGSWNYPSIFWCAFSASIEPDPMDGVDFTHGFFGTIIKDSDLSISYSAGSGGGSCGIAIACSLASTQDGDSGKPFYTTSSPTGSGLTLYADGLSEIAGIPMWNLSPVLGYGTSDFTGVAAFVDYVKFQAPAVL